MSMKDERNRIDEIDRQLVALLSDRFDAARAIGEYKKERGMPIRDIAREEEKLTLIGGMVHVDKLPYISEIFVEIMKQCRAYEEI